MAQRSDLDIVTVGVDADTTQATKKIDGLSGQTVIVKADLDLTSFAAKMRRVFRSVGGYMSAKDAASLRKAGGVPPEVIDTDAIAAWRSGPAIGNLSPLEAVSKMQEHLRLAGAKGTPFKQKLANLKSANELAVQLQQVASGLAVPAPTASTGSSYLNDEAARTAYARSAYARSLADYASQATRTIAGKGTYPDVKPGWVNAVTGRRISQPTSERYQGWTRGEYLTYKNAIPKWQFDKQEESREASRVRWIRNQLAYQSGSAARWQGSLYSSRNNQVAAEWFAQEQATRRQTAFDSMQYVWQRPGWGGMLSRAYQGAVSTHLAGGTPGGLGGLLLTAQQRLTPIAGVMAKVVGPLAIGFNAAMAGIGMATKTVGGALLSVGKSAVSATAGIVRGIMSMPNRLLHSFTLIRHAFWNLTFMAGMVGGAFYAAGKSLAPAGRVETWQKQYALLQGLQMGYTGPAALAAGRAPAVQRINWIRQEATRMRATVHEAIEAGRLMTTYNMFSPQKFRLFSDVQTAYDVPLERVIMPFAYLQSQRFGQFIRSAARFNINPMRLKAEGISMKQMNLPKRRNDKFYKDVFAAALRLLQKDVGGMTGAIGETYEVQVSNLQDAWFNMMAELGRNALPVAKPIVGQLRGVMGRIGERFRNTDYSRLAAGVSNVVGFAGDVITSDKPWERFKKGVSSVFGGKEGIWEALKGVGNRMFERLPALTAGIWDRLAEIMRSGADYLGKVFERLPALWDRFMFSFKLTVGEMFQRIGTYMSENGGILSFVGAPLTGAGAAMVQGGYSEAVSKGYIPEQYKRQFATQAINQKLGVGMLRGKRELRGLPANASAKDVRRYSAAKEEAINYTMQGRYDNAASAWNAAYAVELKYRSGVPGESQLSAGQEAALAESLKETYATIGATNILPMHQQGQITMPGLGIGSWIAPGIKRLSFSDFWEQSWKGFAPKVSAAAGIDKTADRNIIRQSYLTRPGAYSVIGRAYNQGVNPQVVAGFIRENDVRMSGWLKRGIAWTGLGQNPTFLGAMRDLENQTELSEPYSRTAAVAEAVKATGLLAYARESGLDPKNRKKWAAFNEAYNKTMKIVSWRDKGDPEVVDSYLDKWFGMYPTQESMTTDTSSTTGTGTPMRPQSYQNPVQMVEAIPDAIIGTSKGLQESADKSVDVLDKLHEALLVIQDLLK